MILRTIISSDISLRLKWAYFWVGLIAALLLVTAPFLSDHQIFVFSDLAILAVYAVALNLVIGYGGMISLGHAAFFGIGTYSSCLLITNAGMNSMLAFFLAPLFSLVLAIIVGALAVRLSTVYFSMITLAFAEIVSITIHGWYSFTRGDDGIPFSPKGFIFESKLGFYYFVLVVVGISLYIMFRITQSPYGLVLRAIRDNRKRIPMLGVTVMKPRIVAFAISSIFSGMAGALHGFQIQIAEPGSASFNVSITPLLSILLGGAHNFMGPVIGTVFYKSLESFLMARSPELWTIVMGLALILTGIFWPRGFIGLLEDPRWLKWCWRSLLAVLLVVNNLRWFLIRKLRKR